MRRSTRLCLLIVFLACSLSQFRIGNASISSHKLKIYQNVSSSEETPVIVLCEEDSQNIPVLLENQEEKVETNRSSNSNEFMQDSKENKEVKVYSDNNKAALIRNPNSFYHLVKCLSKLDDLKQKAVESNDYQHLNSNTDENKFLIYQRFFDNFKCSGTEKDKEIKCFFSYLGLNYRKVNYSKLNVTMSDIENGFKNNSQFVNKRVLAIILLQPDVWTFKGFLSRESSSKPDIYVIYGKDDDDDAVDENGNEIIEDCGICLDSYKSSFFYTFPCKHKFCTLKLLESSINKCPFCRKHYYSENDENSKIQKKLKLQVNKDEFNKLFNYKLVYSNSYNEELVYLEKIYKGLTELVQLLENKYLVPITEILKQNYPKFIFNEINTIVSDIQTIKESCITLSKNHANMIYEKDMASLIKDNQLIKNDTYKLIEKTDKFKIILNDKKFLEEEYLFLHHKELWKVEFEQDKK